MAGFRTAASFRLAVFVFLAFSAMVTPLSPVAAQTSSDGKAAFEKTITDRTYVFPSPIKTIIVYFGPGRRGVAVLANGDDLAFKNTLWGVHSESGKRIRVCWTGHGKGNSCILAVDVNRSKSYPGDKFNLTARKSTPELKRALR